MHYGTTAAHPDRSLNFHGTFGHSPSPFTIKVNQEFIEATKQRVALTRTPIGIPELEAQEGPPVQNATAVREYWVNEYDWLEEEESINKQFLQFTTTIDISAHSDYEEPVPLHFVHHTSPRKDAIPLLFIHGWPGSFIEIGPTIGSLTHPPNSSLPAFHVVAPSIPGFAFSPAPTKPGYGYIEAAHTFNELMLQLGYDRYVIQGGDAGGIIMRYQASLYPSSVVSGLNNFWVTSPSETDMERYRSGETSEDETAVIELLESFVTQHFGYGQIQQTRPLRLAYALTDSPVGLAMWIDDAIYNGLWDPTFYGPRELITMSMMHWIQGPYGATRIYKEGSLAGAFNLTHFHDLPYVNRPMAISQFPKDIWYRTPLDWAQRTGNVKVCYVHETGGHFPAWENPDLLLQDIWTFFGDRALSDTGTFYDKEGYAQHIRREL
ncbi:hypothetical protein DL768_001507 [Monosporascus sp. mg162]|nr:hypothetical protein DL768_001507 [Monosporascus sp. mg162]